MSPGAEEDKHASVRKTLKRSHDKHPEIRFLLRIPGCFHTLYFLLNRCVLFLFFLFFLFVPLLRLTFSLPAPSGGCPSASAFPLFPLMNDEQEHTEDNQEQ